MKAEVGSSLDTRETRAHYYRHDCSSLFFCKVIAKCFIMPPRKMLKQMKLCLFFWLRPLPKGLPFTSQPQTTKPNHTKTKTKNRHWNLQTEWLAMDLQWLGWNLWGFLRNAVSLTFLMTQTWSHAEVWFKLKSFQSVRSSGNTWASLCCFFPPWA